MACPFGDALAYELAKVFDVVTSFTPEISAVSLGLPAASKPAWVEGKAVSSAKSAACAEFVLVVGRELTTRDGRDGQRTIGGQRLEDRADGFVQLFQTREHAIVFISAEGCGVLVFTRPVRLRSHAPRSAQDVDKFQ